MGIEEFGNAKGDWLTGLQIPNGIPSHDTFGRVFAQLDLKQFEASFLEWLQVISDSIEGMIALDGKTSRRSHDRAVGKKALHLRESRGLRQSPDLGSSGKGGEIK